jgi:hypothetical protein
MHARIRTPLLLAGWLAAVFCLVTESFALSGTYSWGTASSTGSTAVVPMTASVDSNTLAGCVITIDYNGAIADFASVVPGNDVPTWEIVAVNDDQHVACSPADPTNRLTIVIVGDVWCEDAITSGEIVRVTFNKVANGTTVLNANVAVCDYKAAQQIQYLEIGPGRRLIDGLWSPNNAATCDLRSLSDYEGNLTRNNGAVTFTSGGNCYPHCELEKPQGPGTPVERVQWGAVKALWR